MATSLSRRRVGVVVVAATFLAGCAHQPPDYTAVHDRGAVDVAAENPRLSSIGEICADRDMICILAGLAIFGGAVAVIKGSD